MKRIIWIPVLAAMFVAGTGLTAHAGGPACTDITGAGYSYGWNNYEGGELLPGVPDPSDPPRAGDTGSLSFRLKLGGASCQQATYTMYVLESTDDSTVLTQVSKTGDGTNSTVTYGNPDITFAEDDATICVYHTTSIGKHVFDVGTPANEAGETVDNCLTIGDGDSASAQRYH